MMNKHPHHDAIVAWAEGKEIEVYSEKYGWVNVTNKDIAPMFHYKDQYRIKPTKKKIKVRFYRHIDTNNYTIVNALDKLTIRYIEEQPTQYTWVSDWVEIEVDE